jgi:hypothetical protein
MERNAVQCTNDLLILLLSEEFSQVPVEGVLDEPYSQRTPHRGVAAQARQPT